MNMQNLWMIFQIFYSYVDRVSRINENYLIISGLTGQILISLKP